MFLIFIYSALDNQEKAIEYFEMGIAKRVTILLMLNKEPFAKVLHHHPRFLKIMGEIYGEDSQAISQKKKYKKSSLKRDELQLYFSRLEKCMDEEQPYLDPNLSLRQLAGKIDLHPNYLSQLINEKTQGNFSEYVNSYRLECFKNKAHNPLNHHLTILALAYESGFSSKTVFNTFFKKTMGTTPRNFWKSIQHN